MKNLLARVEAAKKKLQDTGKLMEKSLLEISENQVKRRETSCQINRQSLLLAQKHLR
jgi:hypothetical protein